MIYFLNSYLYDLNHTLSNVHSCGQSWGRGGTSNARFLLTFRHPADTSSPTPLPLTAFRAAWVEVGGGWCPLHKLPPGRRSIAGGILTCPRTPTSAVAWLQRVLVASPWVLPRH